MNNGLQPRLLCYMHWQSLQGMPPFSQSPMKAIRAAGYDGIQLPSPLPHELIDEARGLDLGICGSGRVNEPEDAERLAQEARLCGLECLTLHVGWGMEDDETAAALIGAILEASAKHTVPLYPETHRATIFQDPWRTLRFIARFPNLEFNGDLSHWYTGTAMTYGGFENKFEFIRPLLSRVSFMHGRIGDPCCMQVDIGDGSSDHRPYIEHFRSLWIEAFAGFLRRRLGAGAFCFTPELLGPGNYYARTFEGREESDRWQQSSVLVGIARECFEEAKKRVSGQLLERNR
jgi:sugar phosphate isomerase/epimerase